MGNNGQQIQGILAFVTTDKNRYLGGAPLSILANNREELIDFAETIAESFLADIVELKSGDYLIIKK
ncbi:capping complex subunit for YIEGIA [Anaerobacillus sp. MEB173]|uniref:capping complex subunit for YIEGIA n=1 Tax=Anaerobacillus sp. MEB173 TaxID=3383345 RepID=UPI003F92077A